MPKTVDPGDFPDSAMSFYVPLRKRTQHAGITVDFTNLLCDL